jgi:hypothetical protein
MKKLLKKQKNVYLFLLVMVATAVIVFQSISWINSNNITKTEVVSSVSSSSQGVCKTAAKYDNKTGKSNLYVEALLAEIDTKANLTKEEVGLVYSIGKDMYYGTIEDIKNQSADAAALFKEALDGDYVVEYKDSIIIYRKSTEKIIFDTNSDGRSTQEIRNSYATSITDIAKQNKVVEQTYTGIPTITHISDVQTMIKYNAFFRDAIDGDILATFDDLNLVMIYRSYNRAIINKAKIEVKYSEY